MIILRGKQAAVSQFSTNIFTDVRSITTRLVWSKLAYSLKSLIRTVLEGLKKFWKAPKVNGVSFKDLWSLKMREAVKSYGIAVVEFV